MNVSTNTTEKTSLPWHGWLLGGSLLLFGLVSVFDYYMNLTQGEIYYRASGMTETQVTYFSSMPLWVLIAGTLSAWACLFASLSLLLRFKFASLLFFISFAGILFYDIYIYGLSAGVEAMGVLWAIPAIFAIITLAMVPYCRWLTR